MILKKIFFLKIVSLLFIAIAFPVYAKNPICSDVQKCRPFAEQGNPSAQTSTGYYYDKGVRVEQDGEKALEWYLKAAEQGYAAAQLNIGKKYHDGNGVTQDFTKALEWYSKAAEQNYPRANILLGMMYFEGSGVSVNFFKWAEHMIRGTVFLLPVQIILILLPLVQFLCWKLDKKYLNTSLLNKYDKAHVFSFDLSTRMKSASFWLIAGVVCLYLSWIIYWNKFNPYKCSLFALENRPVCIDGAIPYESLAAYLSMILFFALCAYFSFRYLIEVITQKNILLDDSGIWPAHVSKEKGLIPWGNLAILKDKPRSQMTLRDEFRIVDKINERVLCSGHLASIYKLKQSIYDKRPDLIEKEDPPKSLYRRPLYSWALDFFLFLYMVGLLSILIIMPVENKFQLGFFLILCFCLFGYYAFYRPVKVELADRELILTYYFHSVKIPYEEIKSVDLSSISGISLSLLTKKKGIGIDCRVFKAKPEVLRRNIINRMN